DGDADPNRISNGDALFVAQSDTSDIRHRYTCINGERYSDADGDAFRDSYTHGGGDGDTYSGCDPDSGAERLRLLPPHSSVANSGHPDGNPGDFREAGNERYAGRAGDEHRRRAGGDVRCDGGCVERDRHRGDRGELSDCVSVE